MKPLSTAAGLAERVYTAILDEILDGDLAPGQHLVQERLAAELGVSRQPIQQAMALLKADGIVEEIGTRGLKVAALDLERMGHHYELRAVIDGYAAQSAAQRLRSGELVKADCEAQVQSLLAAGKAAAQEAPLRAQIRYDEALHKLIYDWSGNPLIPGMVEPLWRYMHRVMADVLRHAEPPKAIWEQHSEIIEAVLAGEPMLAQQRAEAHVRVAAKLLLDALSSRNEDAQAGKASA